MFKIFKRVKELEKKVEELYDVVSYLLSEDDSNRELIEEHEKRIEQLEWKKLKDRQNEIDTDDLSKFKYDETEC